jgi:glycosyltransferase involved in cell wall biosynthesis
MPRALGRDESQMRVLVVCDWFLKYAGRQAIALSKAGLDVGLMCRSHAFEFGNSREERSSLLQEARSHGVEIFEVEGQMSSIRALPSIARSWRAVAAWGPDIVHAHENYDPRLLAITRRYPSVVTVHDPRPDPRQRPELTGVRAAIRGAWIRKADTVVVHGEGLRSDLDGRVSADRVAVVPHGLQPREAPAPPPERRSVLLLGRLEPYKGLDVLLEAMEIVWAHRPEVVLHVVGAGSAEGRVPADPRIHAVLGYVPEEFVNEMIDEASLVVLPYLVGSQSGVGSLAIARGIPTIVSDVGSLADLALDDSFVVPPGDPAKLASSLLRHLDHDQDVRAAVHNRAKAKFSWDAVARDTLEIYRRVLDSNGA